MVDAPGRAPQHGALRILLEALTGLACAVAVLCGVERGAEFAQISASSSLAVGALICGASLGFGLAASRRLAPTTLWVLGSAALLAAGLWRLGEPDLGQLGSFASKAVEWVPSWAPDAAGGGVLMAPAALGTGLVLAAIASAQSDRLRSAILFSLGGAVGAPLLLLAPLPVTSLAPAAACAVLASLLGTRLERAPSGVPVARPEPPIVLVTSSAAWGLAVSLLPASPDSATTAPAAFLGLAAGFVVVKRATSFTATFALALTATGAVVAGASAAGVLGPWTCPAVAVLGFVAAWIAASPALVALDPARAAAVIAVAGSAAILAREAGSTLVLASLAGLLWLSFLLLAPRLRWSPGFAVALLGLGAAPVALSGPLGRTVMAEGLRSAAELWTPAGIQPHADLAERQSRALAALAAAGALRTGSSPTPRLLSIEPDLGLIQGRLEASELGSLRLEGRRPWRLLRMDASLWDLVVLERTDGLPLRSDRLRLIRSRLTAEGIFVSRLPEEPNERNRSIARMLSVFPHVAMAAPVSAGSSSWAVVASSAPIRFSESAMQRLIASRAGADLESLDLGSFRVWASCLLGGAAAARRLLAGESPERLAQADECGALLEPGAVRDSLASDLETTRAVRRTLGSLDQELTPAILQDWLRSEWMRPRPLSRSVLPRASEFEAALAEAAREAPGDGWPWLGRAQIRHLRAAAEPVSQIRAQELRSALELRSRGLRLKLPSWAVVPGWIAQASDALAIGDGERSLDAASRAVREAPTDAAAWLAKGFALAHLRRWDDAQRALDAARRLRCSPSAAAALEAKLRAPLDASSGALGPQQTSSAAEKELPPSR
ncbi:MAG: hypothetical protein JNJ88_18725 [Planctomycetes bacterium]|nr:hypothetical protein [Planctomycetota bacterium]